MKLEFAISQLENNVQRITLLAQDVSDEQARWKPDEASWSILETVMHLYDEEREDFRVRLNFLLQKPEEEWPPIDPMGWVLARQYNQQQLTDALSGFLDERQHSLEWLRSLESPNFAQGKDAPWGVMHAGDMLAAWVAHDLLHMRQLVELHFAWVSREGRPYSTRYAGEW